MITVSRSADGLRLALPWAAGVRLFPEEDESGFLAADGMVVEFGGPSPGPATEITVTPVGQAMLRGTRIAEP